MDSKPDEWGRLAVYVRGPDAPWTIEALQPVLSHLTERFIVPLDAVQLDLDAPWRAIDAKAIVSAWARNRNSTISFRTPDGSDVKVHLSFRHAVSIWVGPEAFRRHGRDAVLAAAQHLAGAMPGFEYAKATAIGNLGELWSAQDWPWLPLSFGTELYWWQALHPRRYEQDYTRDTLLATPAVKVETWPDGTVSLQIFDDPFDWSTPVSLQHVDDCVRYLAASQRTRRPA